MTIFQETIIALSTAPHNGAIGIIRLSGPESLLVLQRIFVTRSGLRQNRFEPRYLYHGKIIGPDLQVLDDAMAVYMTAPHTFTGEDLVELHCHGNLLLLKRVLRMILSLSGEFNLRAAEPGEFTKRAFLNGKMDLTQAEAVHELITADSEAALQASLSNLDGALQRHIHALKEELRVSLALVEASFEFPEEDIQTFDKNAVLDLVQKTLKHLNELKNAYATSKLVDQGVSVALVGRPNVGKSSLLNAILVEDRAIVTDIAGTTRDVVEGSKLLGGLRFIFRDTAGLRETSDHVESVGIQRSEAWMRKSQIVLWITDEPSDQANRETLGVSQDQIFFRVLNKVDQFSLAKRELQNGFDFFVSALTGEGIQELEERILASVQGEKPVQNTVHINERQFVQIDESLKLLENILNLETNGQLDEVVFAEELRAVIGHLQEITGEISNEDVLGEIFQRFCIGK